MKTILTRNIFLFAFIISAFVYFNCDDSAIVNPESTDFCISGQISNWTLGTKTLYGYIKSVNKGSYSVANCPIDTFGNFKLCLPASVSDTTLFNKDSLYAMGCNNHMTFDPADVKGTQISSLKVKNGSTVIGYIRRDNYDTLFVGAFIVEYLFTTKAVTVGGYTYCWGDSSFFNGSATAGWTKMVENYTKVTPTQRNILYNTTEPAGAIWKYRSY